MYRLARLGDGFNPRQTLLITAAGHFHFGFLKTRGTRLDRLAPGASNTVIAALNGFKHGVLQMSTQCLNMVFFYGREKARLSGLITER
ncbi:hypothetical protein CTR2_R40410 [Comamonas thiooxydans]|uniref:hypothetical protein n=1 Tax=Comamonas thiooxydans TaxID=363952 RepID=UPI000B34C999|nr:hypothetical protein [Comamonas thiooxydans]BDR10703.1 hypothetical protein CTR2_R40410 [Comamonas thiooxydans]